MIIINIEKKKYTCETVNHCSVLQTLNPINIHKYCMLIVTYIDTFNKLIQKLVSNFLNIDHQLSIR